MRAGIAQLPDGETLTDALLLIAAPAVLTPALLRLRRGEQPIAPDSRTDHAADMLRMLSGRVASPALTKALDTYLVTVCDHGLNASTFATRVVASTQAGQTSSVLAGLGALKGRCMVARLALSSRCWMRSRRMAMPPAGCATRSRRAGASWGSAIASTVCAIRAPMC